MSTAGNPHDKAASELVELPDDHAITVGPTRPSPAPATAVPPARTGSGLRNFLGLVVLVVLSGVGFLLAPSALRALKTTSTDDAYVNGHVTFVAPRVQGQVLRVLVDDNMRVSKGDLLVELDPEPYQVQVDIKKSAVDNAEADFHAAEAQARATLGKARSLRWGLQTAMEQVDNYVALLRARVATLRSKQATVDRARADMTRAKALFDRSAIGREEFDQRREAVRVAEALANEAEQEVFETRVYLGLPPHPEKGELTDVPDDLNQTFSGVRQALAELVHTVAQVGLPLASATKTPKKVLEEFISRDKEGNLDRIMERIVPEAPAVRQAVAKRVQAERDLAQAELNLRYCEVRAEIDGVITRRNVNPGNNVAAGEAIMAIRSLTEIWIDANFKETQLAAMKIGQRADIEVDMYGSRKRYRGRVSGFTMGTGQTLALLPPQNATGNYVKIVQRLPVRIDLEDYDPEQETLFVGLSVTPYVFVKEAPRGPGAGKRLQDLRRPASKASR
jgi:membrane fusion protein (multidrug efflux system)